QGPGLPGRGDAREVRRAGPLRAAGTHQAPLVGAPGDRERQAVPARPGRPAVLRREDEVERGPRMIALLLAALLQDPAPATLVDARKIWDQAPHNAFTD